MLLIGTFALMALLEVRLLGVAVASAAIVVLLFAVCRPLIARAQELSEESLAELDSVMGPWRSANIRWPLRMRLAPLVNVRSNHWRAPVWQPRVGGG
ncbi:hypothetical protein GCM10022261_12070 [Brevibacterium daeguense]|uniref:Uncharacterized protein n=1 Tax=Brevibacterium daeguense TaxID=909936 RepID=A0ABP8EI93_9MICO